ncbi:MAG: DUF2254 family protein [Polyangia bacterium]|nr:DUF2254 family protein [Polyangia bacterium]
MPSPTDTQQEQSSLRTWLVSIAFLLSIAAALYFLLYTIDFFVIAHRSKDLGFWQNFVKLSPGDSANVVGGMAEVLAAVLGIIVTVASIIVQLAATRYTPRITDMFFRDRINLSVISYYIIAAIYCLWITYSIRAGGEDGAKHFVPVAGVLLNSLFMTGALLLMAPYFAYVFRFLSPENVVRRIREQTVSHVEDVPRRQGNIRAQQEVVLEGVEQLADVALNTIQNKDMIIASRSVDALRELCVEYLGRKKELPETWFSIGGKIAQNPDFVAVTEERRSDLTRQRTWLEYKVLRQYQMLYAEALNRMRDINYLVAIDTRYVGEAAIRSGDREVLQLAIKFFNTYIRATLNARDIRTAYNVLNQYRILAEEVIKAGLNDVAEDVGNYFKYYGQVAFGMKVTFVTECVAYDLGALNELAHKLGSGALPRLLKILLEVDKEAEAEVQETSLRGVRKAQIKLATYFLQEGEEALARQIFEDMRDERPDRLRSIRAELLAIDSKDFWEIVDRGENFDYLVPERKEKLHVFFGWFPKETVE